MSNVVLTTAATTDTSRRSTAWINVAPQMRNNKCQTTAESCAFSSPRSSSLPSLPLH